MSVTNCGTVTSHATLSAINSWYLEKSQTFIEFGKPQVMLLLSTCKSRTAADEINYLGGMSALLLNVIVPAIDKDVINVYHNFRPLNEIEVFHRIEIMSIRYHALQILNHYLKQVNIKILS